MRTQTCRFCVNGLEIEATFPEHDRDNIYLPLLRHLTWLQREKGRRIAVFLAAPPAAGKSTLCRYLELLSKSERDIASVQSVGLDGFHYPNAYLEAHCTVRNGQRVPLKRVKGAPETFDVAALRQKLATLGEENQFWPEYDRRVHEPIPEAVPISGDIVIIEGNWLLLAEMPWSELTSDYSVFIRAGDESQLERVVARKMMGGFSEAEAREMALSNDRYNIQYCMAHSRRGDLNLRRGANGETEVI